MFEKIDQNKVRIDALRPMQGRLLQQIRDYYKIGLTFSSNALEGNSLTETETKILLEDGLTVGGKPIRDYYEATGHAKAYDYICTLLQGEAIGEAQFKTIHRLFYSLIDEAQAGQYRQEKVIISGSKYPVPSPEVVDAKMKEFFSWLSVQEKRLHPVEFAAKAHKEFVFIHPFVDGNGRVARLLMNLCLLRHGYTPAIIPPVLRGEYIALLEKAHEEDATFVKFIAERVEETQKDLLRLLK
ncbi:MAG: Fic family protein [Negativicutes bacterium]